MRNFYRSAAKFFVVALLTVMAVAAVRADDATVQTKSSSENVWETPFQKGATELDVSAGAGYGLTILGTRVHHHWAIGMVEYGWMLGDIVGQDHWYRGNWEILMDVLGGGQFHPDSAYFAGLGPEFRYNFVTGTRWVPFVNVGAGATATDIRNGDLSTTFEFNLHAGLGIHYFLTEHAALTGQCRLIHFSNAGMDSPNLGVNNLTFMLGASFWF